MGAGRLLPLLVAVVYAACVVACWGLTSLATDTDVIRYPDAGPLLGPAMAVAAALVALGWFRLAARGAQRRGTAVLAAVSVWAAMLVVGAVGYTLTRGSVAWLLLFAGDYAASAYLLLPAVLVIPLLFAAGALARTPKPFDPR